MKMTSMFAATALSAATAFTASPAAATIIQYTSTLSGIQEAPPNGSPGTAAALLTVDDTAFTMRLEVGFFGLLGDTTVTHIHCCVAPPGTAGVATTVPSFPGFPAGVKSGFYDQTFDMSAASSYNPTFLTNHGGTPGTAFVSLLDGLNSGEAYLNIHTDQFPGGEIRGFLLPVPEPASYAMFAGALGLMALAKRRHGQRD